MKSIETVIFDMDGTLYQIDGSNTGYVGSTLESAVMKNARQYVEKMENFDTEQAVKIIEEGLNDPIGLSNFLSERYGITRNEYFQITWDILPLRIVQNFLAAVEVVKKLKDKNIYLILLTSAPKIWQQIVIEFIGLLNYFDEIYVGEEFTTKEDIFLQIAKRFNPETTLSVGDQLKTDILPAQKLGMETVLISFPSDVNRILDFTEKRGINE